MEWFLIAGIIGFAAGLFLGLSIGRRAGYWRAIQAGRLEAARRHVERLMNISDTGHADRDWQGEMAEDG